MLSASPDLYTLLTERKTAQAKYEALEQTRQELESYLVSLDASIRTVRQSYFTECPKPETVETVCQLQNHKIFVFDGKVDQAEVAQVYRRFRSLEYARTESDRADTADVKTFAASLSYGFVTTEPLFRDLCKILYSTLPGEVLIPYRAVVNCTVYGDSTFIHRDCAMKRNDITVLYFVNDIWKRDWGGELLFYDDDGDPRVVIGPRPGRIVIFPGAVEHRVGVPSRGCYVERLTLAYKFRAPSNV